MNIKKGDKVIVIAGKNRGMAGTVTRALPRKAMVVIDGANVVKKHRRATAQNRSGQIIEKTMPLHVSNVQLIDPKSGKPTRVRIRREGGVRARVSTRSGGTL
ncbi:50S ribosomal protein L24 [Candidatus Kaiserbacteria bacterium CG10_big_fil_rev_8_21_14_0_10_59_10]|uniref:Large ribosomal subunit protein uL24 n=1 Tax=Candidatus Kaiserbacteria bacterium CG10_big_fil_rev_8_21_14_0_10_59_10 TaxID=1974612 RepID=A0A2H0U8S4_9BACT|nr:MAG: 50S ribosomal protein L24 [Candidatus Kaiserbacteria bacterium CG10_big_fil_rev_8_21_14_0_10_59_10]